MDATFLGRCDQLVLAIAEGRGSCDRRAVYERTCELQLLTDAGTQPALSASAEALAFAVADDGWIDWDNVDYRFGEFVLALRGLQAS